MLDLIYKIAHNTIYMGKDIKDLPILGRNAELIPKTFNVDDNTIDLIFSTGVRVKRSFFGEVFHEELSMKPDSIRLDRLKRGAPFLNNHNSQSLDSIIGVVERADIKGKKGTATVRLSNRESVKDIVNDIKDGVIRNISVGYVVHEFKETVLDNGEKLFRAIDWEPLELSAVPVPADAGAQFRSFYLNSQDNEVEKMPKKEETIEKLPEIKKEVRNEKIDSKEANEILKEEKAMPLKEKEVRKEAEKEGAKAERVRIFEIQKIVRTAELNDEFCAKHITDGTEVNAVRALAFEKMAESSKKTITKNINEITVECRGKDVFKESVTNALLHRFNPGKYKLSDQGREFRGLTLFDIARESLELNGVKTRGLGRMNVAEMALVYSRSLQSSSDFPLILEDVQNKILRDSFNEAPQTFDPLVRRSTVNDFKQNSRVQLGDGPKLLKRTEDAEFKQGTMGEAAEKFTLMTFGRIVSVSREMIINDDMNAFSRITEILGRRARDLESELVWNEIINNALLGDGNALFSSAHSNLLTPGASPDVAGLGIARQSMRKQKGLDGQLINVVPRWLIVPPELETVADQLVTNITPRVASDVNAFASNGRTPMQVIAEPRLSDTSANASASLTAWFVSADTGQLDIIELASLEGEQGPVIETKEGFRTDGMEMKIRMDVVAKVLEFRGLFKNAGI